MRIQTLGLVLLVLLPLSAFAEKSNPRTILLGGLFPRFSESGEQIAFSYQGAIWQMPREGGVMTQLTDGEGFDVEPVWSPDGKTIAYINGRGSFSGPLRLIKANGGTIIPLPKQILARDKLFFDREGNRLFGAFHRGSGQFTVGWLDLETGELGEELRAFSWGLRYALSHDAKTIALATTQDIRGEQGGNNGPQCDLWILPSDGGDEKKVTRFPGRVYELSWSADNKSLLVTSNVGGVHNDMWQVPLDDPVKGATKLTFGQADEDAACTSRDGRWILMTDNRMGPTAFVLRDMRSKVDSLVTVSTMKHKQATGTFSLSTFDKDRRQPVTARVSVKQDSGKYYAPHGSLYRMLRSEVHFYCNGQVKFNLPVGEYQVKVARGPEYPVMARQIQITAGNQTSAVLDLQRWTNQRELGWFSGESHIHANYGYGQWYNSPRTMLEQCAGEDLNVCNFMVANSEADGVFDREYFRGAPDPLSTKDTVLYWNEEFRSTIWGHMTLLNLKQLVEPIFTGFEHTTNPHDHITNSDIADMTHDQHGHVNYTHPTTNIKDPYLNAYSAKALPLDVALGKIDSIDVMGSNHVATVPLWYRLLNCGFHVPASAGTDCFLNRVRSRLPGQARVYVHVDGVFNYQRWVVGLRAGRTFVTNAPMFDFTVADHLPGATLKRTAPGEVRIKARVTSQYPLNKVEVIFNSKVIGTAKIDGDGLDVSIDEAFDIPNSGWIALRASGPNHTSQPGGSIFGHTSPVYIEVEGHPLDATEDSKYFIEWIDRLRTDIRRRNRIPSRHQVRVETQISDAREVFNNLLRGE